MPWPIRPSADEADALVCDHGVLRGLGCEAGRVPWRLRRVDDSTSFACQRLACARTVCARRRSCSVISRPLPAMIDHAGER